MLPPMNPNPAVQGETMVMLEQEIPIGGLQRAMAQAMAAGEAVGDAEAASVLRSRLRELRGNYYTLWYIDRRTNIATQSRELLNILRASVNVKYQVSLAPQAQVLELSTELESIELELGDLKRWRLQIIAELNASIARPLDSDVVVVSPLPEGILPPYDSLRSLIARHPDLKRMEAMASMNRLEAEAKEAMLQPMLMVRAGGAWMPDGHPVREAQVGEHGVLSHDGGVMRWGLTAGAMLSIPIAPWAAIGPRRDAEARRVDVQRALFDRDDMRNRMEAMLRSSLLQMERARAAVEFARATALPLLEQRLDAAREDYATGRVSFESLMNGYRALVGAMTDLAQRRLDVAIASATIAEITGVQL